MKKKKKKKVRERQQDLSNNKMASNLAQEKGSYQILPRKEGKQVLSHKPHHFAHSGNNLGFIL